MVISAWRRSWPWFQRRRTWWMTRPTRPRSQRAGEQRHDPVDQADVGRPRCCAPCPPSTAGARWPMNAASRNSEPCAMFTVRIRPKIEREPGRDHEQQAGEGESVEQRDDELARLVDRRAGRRATGEHEHPEERRTPPTTTAAQAAGGNARHQRTCVALGTWPGAPLTSGSVIPLSPLGGTTRCLRDPCYGTPRWKAQRSDRY